MRPKHQVLIRCADDDARRCHAFRLDVWGYEPVGQLDYRRDRLRCILMDGSSLERVRDERISHPFTAILVLTEKQAHTDAYLEAGADRVLPADQLGRARNAVLRSAMRILTRRKRGPRPVCQPAAPAVAFPYTPPQEVRLAA